MTMRRLLPEPGDVDDVELSGMYAPPVQLPVGRPFVRVNMISSIDGAVSVDGRSGPLGGVGDRRVFSVLRSWAEVIVVGAGTMRAEQYGPVRFDDAVQTARRARGQAPVPPIAVVSRSANFEYGTPFFTDAAVKPIIVTTDERGAELAGDAETRAEVIGAGSGDVDLAAAMQALFARGYATALVEGGPTLNGDLAAAHVIDELCLTISPRIVMGTGARVLAGEVMSPPIPTETVHLLEDGGFLFARYRFPDAASAA
jgi:riboflavin biosynthesis pyrimidine reductase